MNDMRDKTKEQDHLSLTGYHLFLVKIKLVFYESQKSCVIFIHNFCAFILEDFGDGFPIKLLDLLVSEKPDVIVDSS